MDHTQLDDKATVCLLVLCGIPGCGKSSLARTIRHEMASRVCDAPVTVTVIEFDRYFRDSGTSTFDPNQWKMARVHAFQAIEQALHHPNPSSYHIIIIDDTMHYKSMRAECFKLARQYRAAYLDVYLTCPLETALQRNSQRPSESRIPEEVIRKTCEVFEPPNRDNTNVIVVDASAHQAWQIPNVIKNLCNLIWKAWTGPAPEFFDKELEEERVIAARKATAQDRVHRVDVATRRIITRALQLLSPPNNKRNGHDRGIIDTRTLALELNNERRRLLDSIRSKVDDKDDGDTTIVQEFSAFCDDVIAHHVGGDIHTCLNHSI